MGFNLGIFGRMTRGLRDACSRAIACVALLGLTLMIATAGEVRAGVLITQTNFTYSNAGINFRLGGTTGATSGFEQLGTYDVVLATNHTFQNTITLNVRFQNSFVPVSGNFFDILRETNSRTDTGANFVYTLPTLSPGLSWSRVWDPVGYPTSKGLRLQVNGTAQTNQVGLSLTGVGTDRGDITVQGSNGAYVSNVLDLSTPPTNPNGFNSGYVDVLGSLPTPNNDGSTGPTDPAGPVYVLIDLEGATGATLSTFLASLSQMAGSFQYVGHHEGDDIFNRLAYGEYQGPTRDWDTALEFNLPAAGVNPGSLKFSWNFAGSPSIFLQQMAIAPEPTSLSLLFTFTLLLRRTRRS